jgi:hypothetical protein
VIHGYEGPVMVLVDPCGNVTEVLPGSMTAFLEAERADGERVHVGELVAGAHVETVEREDDGDS